MRAIIFMLVLCSSATFAQSKRPMSFYEPVQTAYNSMQRGGARSYVELTVGIALPGNSFGAVTSNQPSGYAGNGFYVSANGARLLYKQFGIGASFGRYTSAFMKSSYKQNLLQQLPDGITGNLQAQKWHNTLLTVGPVIMIPQNNIMLDLYIQAGVLTASLPQTIFTGFDEESSYIHQQSAAHASALATMAGMHISYLLPKTDGFRIVAKADFIGASPVFTTKRSTQWNDVTVQSQHQSRQSVGVVALSVGMRYEFAKHKHLPDK